MLKKSEEFKTLTPEQFRALEDVVGPDHVTISPNLVDGYCFSWGNEKHYGNKFAVRPLGAILPESTEEVQAIVRICNRFKIPFKAHGTGFGPGGMNADAPFLSIDLRLMDRIIEIDEKNMIAVFEPYVSFAALMNACIKKKVRPYIIGAGPSCSVLANATNVQGYGTTNVSAGFGGRVPLSVEWVMPDGEIMKMGTLGTSGQWFCGDGPGPSLRGIYRGSTGTMGALGVFTKLSIKLVPWYGPSKISFYGKPPQYKVNLPEGIEVYTLMFLKRDDLIEAMRLLQEEKIVYWASRRGPFTMAAAMTGSNLEVLNQWESDEFQAMLSKFNHNLSVGLDSSSKKEAEFKRKCMMKILDKFNGELFEETADGMTARFVHAYNGLGAVKGTFRSTGGMSSTPATEEALDAVNRSCNLGVAIKKKYGEMGTCLNDGDSTWITLLEDFCGHMEVPSRYDISDQEKFPIVTQHVQEANQMLLDERLGIADFESGHHAGPIVHEEAGPLTMNYHTWVKRFKKMLDPNLVGEGTRYPQPD